jgi:hypothetical protein
MPGDLAVARESFSAHIKSQARISDGPWYAYLLPGLRWIDPPNIPADAIPLGEVRIVHTPEMGPMAIASIEFVVPDLETGSYTVSLCNDPCTATIVGDLVGGGFTVVGSPEEFELLRERDRLERQLSSTRYRLSRKYHTTERQLRAEAAESARWEAQAVGLTRRVDALETVLVRSEDGNIGGPLGIAGWGLAAVAATVAVLIARRRKPASVLAPFPPPQSALADRPDAVPQKEAFR